VTTSGPSETKELADPKQLAILFVCTGNICRSPTAEGVFRRLANQAGLSDRLTADSAGLHGYHIGEAPDPRTCRAARSRGYDLGGLRARTVEADDFHRFDLILAMDDGHYRALKRMAPRDGHARIDRFLALAPTLPVREVADPYYGGADGFEQVLDLVEAGCRALIDAYRRGALGPAPTPPSS